MRFALLVCLLATATASYIMPHGSFQQGRTYDYRFRTQVSHSLLTDLPQAIREQAVTGLQANLKLTFTNDRHARVQLQNVRLGELNGPMEQGQEQMIPSEAFEKREMPQEMKEKLSLPFSVSLVDGVVENIRFQERDSVWSKNIKRAALNLIQLNLKRNDVQGLKMESSQPHLSQEEKDRQPIVFTVPEITLEGQCETTYTVQERSGRNDEQQQQFNVTKNVNFNQCRKVSDVSYGVQVNTDQQLRCLKCLRQADMKPTAVGKTEAQEELKLTACQQECQTNQLSHQQNIERSTVGRFVLHGSRDKYHVQRSQIISQYVVKAQNPQAQNTISQVVSISELVFRQQESEQPVPEVQTSSKGETLQYSPEWDVAEKRFYMWGDEEFETKNSPFSRVSHKSQKAAEMVRQILKQWNEQKETGYELNTALIFNQLVQIARQSTVPELKQIEEQIKQIEVRGHGTEKHAMTLYLDALAVAATRNTLYVLEQKIKQSEISTIKAAQLIKIFIANQHSPSDRQADLLEKIANSQPAQQCPVLKQTAWLSFGAAVGRICQQKPAESQHDHFRSEKLCPETKKEVYKKSMLLNLKNAEEISIYENILALKVIGNAALEQTLPELKKTIVDKRQPTLIRMEAIDALRRLRSSQPQKIQQILLPIFQNQREMPEIRMAAVSMIFYTQPPQVILDQIVFSVQNDRSQNVKTFVLTALESLSRSPVSAEQQVAQHMKAALKFVKLAPEQMRNSRKYRVPIYVSEQQDTEEQNILIGLASIISPSNMIPAHLSASIRSAFNGDAMQENINVYFTQKDLEQLYEKLANVYGSYQGQDDETQERQSAKDLRQIYSSLGIKSRRSGSYFYSSEETADSRESGKRSGNVQPEQPFGMIVIRTNDIDRAVLPIDEQKIPQLVRKYLSGEQLSDEHRQLRNDIATGKQFQQHIALNVNEQKTKIPTSAGLPLEITWQTSAVASIQGKIQGEIDFARSKVDGELKLRTSAIATHMHKTECWSPAMISGVQTLRTIELNHNEVSLKVESSNGEVFVTLNLPKQEQKERVLGLHTLPATFIQKFDWETLTPKEPRLRAIRNLVLEPMQKEYHMESQQHRAIRAEGNIHQVWEPKQMLNALYTTENNLHVYYKPTESTPTQLTARISGFSFRRSEHKKPEFDDFYHGKPSQRKPFRSIYEDEDEEFKSMELSTDNKERHSRLSSFVGKYQPLKAYKHQLKVELKAKSEHKSHEANILLQGQCDQHMQHCEAAVNFERTPFGEERENWVLDANVKTVAPEQIRNEEETEQKQSRLLVKAETTWGPSSGDQQEIHVRIQGEPTRKTYWQSDSANKWSRFLNKVDLFAEYKLHSTQRHFVERLFNLGKFQYFWQLSTNAERKGEPQTIRASIVIDPITRRHFNFTVQTQEERTQGKMLELPLRIQPFSLERRAQQVHSFGQLIQSYSQQNAECRADDRRVRTFDGVAYRAPMSSCWSVLAKDCSRETPRFVVLMKKTESGESKQVKIITPESTIELQKQPGQQQIVVMIDGKQETNEERLQEQGVDKSDYQVYVQKRGVSVRFDGEEASIKVSGIYKSAQCGLCGHHDDEESDIFRMPNNKQSQSLKDFHQSYTLKNQECEEQKLKKFYQDNDSEEFQVKQKKHKSAYFRDNFNTQYDENSSEERDGQWWASSEEKENSRKNKPVDSTKTLEYAQKLCFSVKPVKKCPQGTTPDEQSEPQEVKIQFFCLERHSAQARRLQRQVRQGKIVDPSNFQPSFYDTVEQPTKCQPAEYF